MAFSDPQRRFWRVDLTTRVGALSAAKQGATACFIFAGLAVLGLALLGGMAGYSTTEGMAVMAGAAFESAVAIIAGLRLRSGKGAFWGMAAALLCVLETIGKVLALSAGVVITGVLLVAIIQGVRGALALRNDKGFEDDEVAVFE